MLKELNKNPLSPLVIIGIRGIDLAAPVKRDTERLDLLFKTRDIVLCNDFRVDMIFNSVVFGRQTESVPAYRIKHVKSL